MSTPPPSLPPGSDLSDLVVSSRVASFGYCFLQQTIGDLLTIDQPLSLATVEANQLWLRTAHPDHFFKDTDRPSGSAAGEFVDGIGPATESDRRRSCRSSGSSRRQSNKSNKSSNSRNSSNSRDASDGLDKENGDGLHAQHRRDGGGQGLKNVRRDGGIIGQAGVEDGTRTRPLKRRRETGGVLVSLFSLL